MSYSISSSVTEKNPSLEKLIRDLDSEVSYLRFLPIKQLTIERQNEINGIAPYRILYGDMVDEKDQLWAYFTHPETARDGSNHRYMVSFFSLKSALTGMNSVRSDRIQHVAVPTLPFKHARNHYEILSLAKYYFVRLGIDDAVDKPLVNQTWRLTLVQVCKHYKQIYKQNKSRKDAGSQSEEELSASSSSKHARQSSTSHKSKRVPSADDAKMKASQPLTRSISQVPRKRTKTFSPLADTEYGAGRSSSPWPMRRFSKHPEVLPREDKKETSVERYVNLQEEETELDHMMAKVEAEEAELIRQLAKMQEQQEKLKSCKADLQEQKTKLVAESEALLNGLSSVEQLRFGLEAGKIMERKRLRRS